MSKAVKVAPALSPLSAIYSSITDALVHIPFHGGGAGAINLAATQPITQGSTTKITLGSTPSPLPMAGTYVKIASVTPAAYNGYHKVLDASGANVWLDLDSGAFDPWTSGGAMSFNVLYDRAGNLPAQDVRGLVTGIWANPADGLTTDSGGSYTSAIPSADLSAFDLDGFAGFVVLSVDVLAPATPSAEEFIFSIGRSSATGPYSGSGHLSMKLQVGQAVLSFRPRTVAGNDADGAGGGSNVSLYSTMLGTTAPRTVTFLLDLRDTANVPIYAYLDGVLKASASANLTNMLDWPGITNGAAIGGNLGLTLTPSNLLGAATPTPSQARVQNLLWWKTTKSLADVQKAILGWATTHELPREVI